MPFDNFADSTKRSRVGVTRLVLFNCVTFRALNSETHTYCTVVVTAPATSVPAVRWGL
jgi:hypothetical protein